MAWLSKEQPTPFDTIPLEGLVFRIGDLVERKYHDGFFEGKKQPRLVLPSSTLPLKINQEQELQVVLGCVADIPVFATSDGALQGLTGMNSPFNVEVWPIVNDDHHIQVHVWRDERVYFVTYDNEARCLADVMIDSA